MEEIQTLLNIAAPVILLAAATCIRCTAGVSGATTGLDVIVAIIGIDFSLVFSPAVTDTVHIGPHDLYVYEAIIFLLFVSILSLSLAGVAERFSAPYRAAVDSVGQPWGPDEIPEGIGKLKWWLGIGWSGAILLGVPSAFLVAGILF